MTRSCLSCVLGIALCASPVLAQRVEIGVGAGLVTPDEVDTNLWLTANLRIHPTAWMVVEPEVGYWRHTSDKDACVPDLERCLAADARLRDLSTGVNVLFLRPAGTVRPWGGGGVGAHFLQADLTFPELSQTGSRSETALGLHVLGGVDVRVTPWVAVFGAGRFDAIRGREIDQFKAYAGVRLGF